MLSEKELEVYSPHRPRYPCFEEARHEARGIQAGEYAGDPESFAWVLPIKGTVELGLSSDALFQALDPEWPAPALMTGLLVIMPIRRLRRRVPSGRAR